MQTNKKVSLVLIICRVVIGLGASRIFGTSESKSDLGRKVVCEYGYGFYEGFVERETELKYYTGEDRFNKTDCEFLTFDSTDE